MPELPEVETVRAGIAPWLEGAKIINVVVHNRAFRKAIPDNFESALIGNRIRAVKRRAKYLVFHMPSGGFIGHLGMSGSIRRLEKNEPPRTHDHVILITDKASFAYHDPRRFGGWDLWQDEPSTHEWLSELGPEPLGNDFNGEVLLQILQNRLSPVKLSLLNQNLIAGIGNIYASEALWRAGVLPTRVSSDLTLPQCEQLAAAIRSVLRDAIASGGSTLRNHRNIEGELGYFQHRFDAYDREGENCRRENCAGQITKITQSTRSSFYCPHCQA